MILLTITLDKTKICTIFHKMYSILHFLEILNIYCFDVKDIANIVRLLKQPMKWPDHRDLARTRQASLLVLS